MKVRRGAVLAALVWLACTKAEFIPVPKPDPAKRDDRVSVEGDFCTTNPETLNFPVKLLFIVDRSQSMNVTDPDVNVAPMGQPPLMQANRVRALLEAIQTLSAVEGLEFGMIGFGSATTPETERCDSYRTDAGMPNRVNCEPGFTTDIVEAQNAAFRTGNPGGGNTDFAAALTTAYTMLFRDMSKLSDQDAGNARYVIIFMSDGLSDVDANATTRGELSLIHI